MNTLQHTNQTPLLEVKDFSLTFRQYQKGLHETSNQVIKKLNLTVCEGEITAVVGASGSGKSVLANAILGLTPQNAESQGTLNYKGQVLTPASIARLRGSAIQLIPQTVDALDPLMKTGRQVQTAVGSKIDKKAAQRDVFQKAGLPLEAGNLYPFELSGGMARKVLTSSALLSSAELIIADEPTPGLDPEALNNMINNLKELADAGKGIMVITHDIKTALKLADKVVVFYQGETVEIADASDFTGDGGKLRHPYTRALWRALPQNDFTLAIESSEVAHTTPQRNVRDSDTSHALQVRHAGFYYQQDKPLFKNLSLTIHPGEIVGLFGYSGSGKTTLATVMAGYMKPCEGSVIIDGETAPGPGPHPVQLVWQHPEKAINPRWRMHKVLSDKQRQNTARLNDLDVQEEWLRRWPSELSGGELQRISMLRALNSDTRYLIADEMTSMLDAITQANIWQTILHQVKQYNLGVLAISHDYQLLQRVSDRIIDFNTLSNV